MLCTDFQLKIVNKMSQLFVFAEITWKQGDKKKIQTLFLTELQTLGILNLQHGEASTIQRRLFQDCKQATSGPCYRRSRAAEAGHGILHIR